MIDSRASATSNSFDCWIEFMSEMERSRKTTSRLVTLKFRTARGRKSEEATEEKPERAKFAALMVTWGNPSASSGGGSSARSSTGGRLSGGSRDTGIGSRGTQSSIGCRGPTRR